MIGDDSISDFFGSGVNELTAPAASRKVEHPVTVGFVALIDCAPLIVAREKGFAAGEGLDLTLVREPSWANIRDRVVLGHFDAAHMLAPMTIAATLRLGALDAPLLAPFVLNLCGNAIAVSTAVHRAMAETGEPGGIDDPAASGRALKRAVDARKAAGEPPYCFAVTYPFSSHNYELRYWLAAAGIDPEVDVRLVVVPPPMMAAEIQSGRVDGFCAGAPWPSVAVDAGVGHIVATSAAMKPAGQEKVLGVRASWADRHPERLSKLIRALQAACDWCEMPENTDELAELLARPDHIDAPVDIVRRSLTRELIADPGGQKVVISDYIRFAGDATNRPRVADALWYATQMVRWGQVISIDAAIDCARATFRPDLYDRAIGMTGWSATIDGSFSLFDGVPFEPATPNAYLGLLSGST
jgi:NitT/TauT family transport system ATP-binding protein